MQDFAFYCPEFPSEVMLAKALEWRYFDPDKDVYPETSSQSDS